MRTPTHNAHTARSQKAMQLAKALYLADGGHWGKTRDEFDRWLDAAIEEAWEEAKQEHDAAIGGAYEPYY